MKNVFDVLKERGFVKQTIYEDELHNKIQKLTIILEPMLILFIACIVIILLIAIFIPLFSMLNNIGAY